MGMADIEWPPYYLTSATNSAITITVDAAEYDHWGLLPRHWAPYRNGNTLAERSGRYFAWIAAKDPVSIFQKPLPVAAPKKQLPRKPYRREIRQVHVHQMVRHSGRRRSVFNRTKVHVKAA